MAIMTSVVRQVGPTTSEATIRQHTVLIDRPESKGGHDQGAMGGELLLAALGGCFMSNLLEAVRTREAVVSRIEVVVSGTLEGAPPRYTAMELLVSADYADEEQFKKLVTISERSCIVSNTLKAGMPVTVRVEQWESA
jgi:putative redox protein